MVEKKGIMKELKSSIDKDFSQNIKDSEMDLREGRMFGSEFKRRKR